MRNLSVLLIASLLPACVSSSFQVSQPPAERLSAFDHVRVDQFEIGDLRHLPLADQTTARRFTGTLSRKLQLKLFERGMFTGVSGEALIIKGKLVRYDPSYEWNAGQWGAFLFVLPVLPPVSLFVPPPIYLPFLPGKIWSNYEGDGSLYVETTFQTEDGTLIAAGTARLGVDLSTTGGDVEYAARKLVTSIAEFVETNY